MLISSSIDIKSSIDKVWAVLVDIPSYHKWNSFTPKIDVNFSDLNSDVLLHVKMNPESDKIIKQKETLLLFEPEKYKMVWGINGSAFFLKTVRIQQLSALENGETRYYTSDEFWGILTPIVKLFYGNKVQNGFDRVAVDLKHFCEAN